MAAVHLDYLAGRRSNWPGILALAIGVASLMSAVWYYRDLSREISDQEALVSKLRERENGRSMSTVTETRDAEQVARETKQVNAAILALSLPWNEFFEAFEATRTDDVAVLAIEPDAQKGLVRISAEANKLENMLNYVATLQKIAMFREVLILNHQIQDQDPQKPIRFVVQAVWGMQR
jgi:hypothetical protein